jgi:hypothetical protein
MRSMNTFEGPLVAFCNVIEEDRCYHVARRVETRRRYDEAVVYHVTTWREGSGYKLGPMINDQQVRRSVASWMGAIVEYKMLDLCLPLFDIMQCIERALHHVAIFSSPSGNHDLDRYAPKPPGTIP